MHYTILQPQMIIRIRKNFGLPDDDPRAYEEIHHTWERKGGAALPSGEDVVDAEYEECDESVQ